MKIKLFFAIFGILLLIGCTQQEELPLIEDPEEPLEPEPVVIEDPDEEVIINILPGREFDIKELEILIGTKVTWVNNGNYPELISLYSEEPFENVPLGTLGVGESVSHTFINPYNYEVSSKWSGNLRGTIKVTE